MKLPARPFRHALSVLVLAALAACGGGGGGGGGGNEPADPIVITAANAPAVAAQAIDASQAGFLGEALPVGVQVEGSTVRPVALTGALRSAARLVRQARGSGLLLGVEIVPVALDCIDGGTVTISGEVADEETLSVGDSLTLAFAACVEGGGRLDGTMSITITEVNTALTLLAVNASARNFTTTALGVSERVNGALRLRLDDTDPTRSRLEVAATRFDFDRIRDGAVRASRTLLDYDYLGVVTVSTGAMRETVSFEASGNFRTIGTVSFNVATTAPVITAGGAERPSSGAAVVTGANGTSVKLTVISGGLRLDVDTDGDGDTEETLTRTWAQIDAEL